MKGTERGIAKRGIAKRGVAKRGTDIPPSRVISYIGGSYCNNIYIPYKGF